MKALIKQARITDPNSSFNGQITDIFIENGVISQIGKDLSVQADQVIDAKGACLSPGWVDVFAHFGDPGYEYKESLESGSAAAAAGGFTDVFVIPNTQPVLQSKSNIEYIVSKAKALPVNIRPIGAITRGCEGKDLAEMYDMRASGAVAFSDGIHAVQSAGLLVKALQYVKAFNGVLIQLPDDKSINPHGLMHEGIISTQLGMAGKPALAEELVVNRDIELTRYAESQIHFTAVSTARSVDAIRAAKKEGPGISCSVTPYHLFFCDEDITTYDSNLKVNPPLRSKEDRAALISALQNGDIDCIATHHLPHEYDSKVLEFEYAKFGMIGLETAFGVLQTAVPEVKPELWVQLLAIGPRAIFGLDPVTIEKGAVASLTLFDPKEKWTVTEKDLRSRSKNTPFTGKELTGKVKGIFNKDAVILQ